MATDSYKLTHHSQYPSNTESVYSYLEARKGAKYPNTVFFGLQYLLQEYLEGQVIDQYDIDEAEDLAANHFGNPGLFNKAGWQHILDYHNGELPLRIKAVPEGSVVPVGNALMTVENTDPACWWLTNAIESLLLKVWYPTTVATLSRDIKLDIYGYLEHSAESINGLPFMLHDFGYRGATSEESAALGGAAHLVNFQGTDTLPAIQLIQRHYGDLSQMPGFSVPATEHSVMTALGEQGEFDIVGKLLDQHPTGILSVVADSYDIYMFVAHTLRAYRHQIAARDGVFVVRPDSLTHRHSEPGHLVCWILHELADIFGSETNAQGYQVLPSYVRVLWGDGLDQDGIRKILSYVDKGGFSAENLVFGMGGGLLQQVNRDTQRFAFKCSAQKREGVWHDIYKKPLDITKASKRGRLMLVKGAEGFQTISNGQLVSSVDLLEPVFEDGEVLRVQTFEDVRERAALPLGVTA